MTSKTSRVCSQHPITRRTCRSTIFWLNHPIFSTRKIKIVPKTSNQDLPQAFESILHRSPTPAAMTTTTSLIATRIFLLVMVMACIVVSFVSADPVKVYVYSPPPEEDWHESEQASALLASQRSGGCSNPSCTLCPGGAMPLAQNVVVTIAGVANNVSCKQANRLAKKGCVKENWCRPMQSSLKNQCGCP